MKKHTVEVNWKTQNYKEILTLLKLIYRFTAISTPRHDFVCVFL